MKNNIEMKKIFLVGLILLSSTFLSAQIGAITETGEQVILNKNGTWEYLNQEAILESKIPTNNQKFIKDKQSTFLVKSKKLNIGIWIDPKKWSFKQGTLKDEFEFQFQKKNDDLYALLISEKVQIPIETLKGLAIEIARDAAQDVKVVKEEYRTVNGIQVLMMQMVGTIQGIKFTYYGYYFSNSNGTIQLLAYTGESLYEQYLDDIELLINGLVEL